MKKVGVSYGRKKSDGNYGSVEASAWVEYEVDDEQDARELQERAHGLLKIDVERRLVEVLADERGEQA